eukprot:CAMPEP_0170489274 /NCGR_PEP_ID=MMETSP0208-20121228/7647_1 /TAXON_ID=197538 /ORGANISM="Strombidium inclinatum, Strain S3" /LENGTH=56 /DNA_ID=CAMNT_0010764121 /DNA_START=262 /DNA_END=432 /DNA_ORIENTATION=-
MNITRLIGSGGMRDVANNAYKAVTHFLIMGPWQIGMFFAGTALLRTFSVEEAWKVV